MIRFIQSQRVLWHDSLTLESIQARKKWKIEADNIWIDSEFLWIDSRKLWIDSLWIYLGKLWIDSLRYYSRKLWIDSLRYYSRKFDSIQKKWHKENGQKECLIWINESWIESRNSRKDFPYMITHKISRKSHDTMRHGLLGALTSFYAKANQHKRTSSNKPSYLDIIKTQTYN